MRGPAVPLACYQRLSSVSHSFSGRERARRYCVVQRARSGSRTRDLSHRRGMLCPLSYPSLSCVDGGGLEPPYPHHREGCVHQPRTLPSSVPHPCLHLRSPQPLRREAGDSPDRGSGRYTPILQAHHNLHDHLREKEDPSCSTLHSWWITPPVPGLPQPRLFA